MVERVRLVLSDAQWARIAEHIIGDERSPGTSGRDNRMFVEGVLWIVRTGAPWRDLPANYRNGFRDRKLGTLMDDSEDDVLAYLAFPAPHRTKLHSTNPLERLNKEVKRRADVVGIFPSEASIIRLIGAVLLEANDEWQLQHPYMGVEALAELINPPAQPESLQLPPKAA